MSRKNPTELYLIVANPWFGMEARKIKLEEYRDFKDYYIRQFIKDDFLKKRCLDAIEKYGDMHLPNDLVESVNYYLERNVLFKKLHFANGMCSAEKEPNRHLCFRNPKIRLGIGRLAWGAKENAFCFIITWED